MCESVAIVDHGRLVAGGRVRDLKRAQRAADAPASASAATRRRRGWPALPGVGAARSDASGLELELLPSADPAVILSAVLAHGASVSRFEVVEPSLETLFIEYVGRPSDDEATLAPGTSGQALRVGDRRLMAGRDPILPNAGIIARREYRDRTRSPLFVVSTIVLAGLAMVAALAPIGDPDRRPPDRDAHRDRRRATPTWPTARRLSRTRSSTSRRPASPTRTSSIRTRSRSRPIRPPPRPV